MAELVLHQIDPKTLAQLDEMAAGNRMSVEDQAKVLLMTGLEAEQRRVWRAEAARRIAGMTPQGKTPGDSVQLLREDRDR